MGRTLVFDIETHSAEYLYTMSPGEFVRLIGYSWDGGKVVLTTDLEEIRYQIRHAEWIIGHNINAFDLPAVFGVKSDEPWHLAQDGRVYDTWTHATLVHPAPSMYVNRLGKSAKATKPEEMRKWFGLDEQAYQLGVPGKTHDLKELAFEFGDPELKQKARIASGFGRIPVDDERYRGYLIGDVRASEAVARALLKKGALDEYAMREQKIAACAAVISANGLRVDKPVAEARVNELAVKREEILDTLVERYDFPTEGKSPWATTQGETAILAALADQGITPETVVDWPKTPVADKRSEYLAKAKAKVRELKNNIIKWEEEITEGNLPTRSVNARVRWIDKAEVEIAEIEVNPLPVAFGLSLSGETLIELTKGTDAEDLGRALAELKGQRSLALLALDSTHPDGFCHPEITMLQRSGRWSTTEPGLTIWDRKSVEKSYFLPDSDDQVLIEVDYSNADARVVAALSGDLLYAERFEPGADGHMINAYAAWGKEVVDTDPKHYRQMAKPLGHGWSYGGQYKTLSRQAGVPLEDAKRFCEGMASTYSVLVGWQNKVRYEAQQGYVMNEWGRKLWVEQGREFTQAPALKGQNGTREIVCDAILRMPIHVLRTVKAQIHDALLFSVPKRNWEACRDYLIQIMETSFKPASGGQPIEFPVESGPPGRNWLEAAH